MARMQINKGIEWYVVVLCYVLWCGYVYYYKKFIKIIMIGLCGCENYVKYKVNYKMWYGDVRGLEDSGSESIKKI